MAYNVKFLDCFLDELDDICNRCSEELKLDNLSKQLRKTIKTVYIAHICYGKTNYINNLF